MPWCARCSAWWGGFDGVVLLQLRPGLQAAAGAGVQGGFFLFAQPGQRAGCQRFAGVAAGVSARCSAPAVFGGRWPRHGWRRPWWFAVARPGHRRPARPGQSILHPAAGLRPAQSSTCHCWRKKLRAGWRIKRARGGQIQRGERAGWAGAVAVAGAAVGAGEGEGEGAFGPLVGGLPFAGVGGQRAADFKVAAAKGLQRVVKAALGHHVAARAAGLGGVFALPPGGQVIASRATSTEGGWGLLSRTLCPAQLR